MCYFLQTETKMEGFNYSTNFDTMKSIAIIGTGPAGLMAGYQLLKNGHSVSFYDHKKAAGRKFLVAGHGGFNLTHSSETEVFQDKYNHEFVRKAVAEFTNDDTILWLQEIGIPTFVGSSGKIFPEKGIKPIEVLNAWIEAIEKLGGIFHFKHDLIDFCENEVKLTHLDKVSTVSFDTIILSLGGASWTKTGSTGSWITLMKSKGIKMVDFESSNAGMNVKNWKKENNGIRLKNCSVRIGNLEKKGEVLFTEYGLEGAPVYALNDMIRKNHTKVFIDLKPMFDANRILTILKKTSWNRSKQLTELKLSKETIQYLRETLSKENFLDDEFMSKAIKNLPFEIVSLRPIEEAISTVGGIAMNEINEDFELKKVANCYAIGEMLDWDAPTGGFLLQACFSTGFVAAQAVINKKWINRFSED